MNDDRQAEINQVIDTYSMILSGERPSQGEPAINAERYLQNLATQDPGLARRVIAHLESCWMLATPVNSPGGIMEIVRRALEAAYAGTRELLLASGEYVRVRGMYVGEGDERLVSVLFTSRSGKARRCFMKPSTYEAYPDWEPVTPAMFRKFGPVMETCSRR